MNNATPAPWKVREDTFRNGEELAYNLAYIYCNPDDNVPQPAVCVEGVEEDGTKVILAFLGNGPRAKRHAQLIAAIPLMVRALQAVMTDVDVSSSVFQSANDALDAAGE